MEEKRMVTITEEEYNKLLENKAWLYCLEAVGVDNWEGYDIARKMFNEQEEEEK